MYGKDGLHEITTSVIGSASGMDNLGWELELGREKSHLAERSLVPRWIWEVI